MADNEVRIKLVVEGNAKVELSNATKAVQEFGDAAEKSAQKASGAFDVFKGVLAADAVKAGLGLLKDAAVSLFNTFVVDGVAASQQYQDALQQLSTQLKLSGYFSQEAVSEFEELANTIERSSKVNDDAVLRQAAYAKSLGLSNDQTKKLLQASVELSAITGKDLDASVQELAKSYEGIEGKSIKLLEATSGLTKEQLKNGAAIDAILQRYGGSAQSQLQTFSGGLTQIENAFEDLQKEIGNAITTNVTVIAVFNKVAEVLQGFGEQLEGNKLGMQEFVSQGVLLAIQGLEGLVTVADVVYRAFAALVNGIAAAALAVGSGITGIAGIVSEEMSLISENMGRAAKEAGSAFKSSLVDDNALTSVRDVLGQIETAARNSMGAVREGATAAVEPVNNMATAVKGLTDEQVKLQEEARKVAEEVTKSTLSQAEQIQAKQEVLDNARSQNLIKDDEYFKATAGLEQQFADNKSKIEEALAKEEEERRQQRIQATNNTLNALASLQNSKSKELQAVGKAAAIAQTMISTFTGATGAFAALSSIPFIGPALGFAAAAAITAAGLANVSRIRGTPLATGIDEVPAGFPNDTFPARLTSGERVVPKETNRDLKVFLREQAGTKELLAGINDKLGKLQNQIVVNVGNREIINTIQDALDDGRRLAL